MNRFDAIAAYRHERVEDLHARAAKVPIVPGDDGQAVATGRYYTAEVNGLYTSSRISSGDRSSSWDGPQRA